MSKRVSIIRYHHIINKLRRSPSSFEEILDYLIMQSEIQGYDFEISTRTFQRDCNDIREIYQIDIQYDTTRKAYRIMEEYQEEAQERALEAFDLFNALNVTEQLSDFIHFEKRRPLGTEYIYELLKAIRTEKIINFSYQKFGSEDTLLREIEPYALKEDKFRWYLVGKDVKADGIRIFGLDRLSDLVVKRDSFTRPKFDVEQFFKDYYGVDRYQRDKLEKVVLSFTPFQGNYIKTLPLHESQRVMVDNDQEVRVELELYITLDFIMELLSFSDELEVIEPARLRKTIHARHQAAVFKYEVRS